MAGFPKREHRTGEFARQPMSGVHIDSEVIKNAIIKARGNMSKAADKIGCARNTIHARVNNEPELKQVLDNCRERFLDESEDVLQSKVLAGDTTSLIFTLKTLGRSRGYDLDQREIVEHATKGILDYISNKSKNPAES